MLLKLLICLLVLNVKALKILMFQVGYGPSHIQFSNTLGDVLHSKGHVVVSTCLKFYL